MIRSTFALLLGAALLLWSCAGIQSPPSQVASRPAPQDTDAAASPSALDSFTTHAESGNFSAALKQYPAARPLVVEEELLSFDLGAASMAMIVTDFQTAKAILQPWDAGELQDRNLWNALALIEAALGNFEAHAAYLEDLLEVFPQDADALASLGLSAYMQNKNSDALSLFNRALASNAQQATALQYRAELYAGMEDYPRALADLDSLLELEPELDTAWSLRGRIYDRMGRGEDAIANLARAIELGPDNPWNWWDRGRVYFRRGVFDKAASDLERALELDPDNVLAADYLAQSRLHLRSYEAAAKVYAQLLSARPDYFPAYQLAAVTYFTQGDYRMAQRYFLAAGDTREGRPAHILLSALASIEAGRPEEARQLLEAKMGGFPTDSIWTQLARFVLGSLAENHLINSITAAQLPAFDADSARLILALRLRQLGRASTSLALLTEIEEDTLRGTPEGFLTQWLTPNER